MSSVSQIHEPKMKVDPVEKIMLSRSIELLDANLRKPLPGAPAVDVLPSIAYHGGPRGSFVRASAYAELDGECKRQSIYPGSGPRP